MQLVHRAQVPAQIGRLPKPKRSVTPRVVSALIVHRAPRARVTFSRFDIGLLSRRPRASPASSAYATSVYKY